MNYLLVALGGGIGAVLRYGTGKLVANMGNFLFPIATFAVNFFGAFAIGLLSSILVSRHASQGTYLLLVTGLLGGFTTFSAFSLETVNLFAEGHVALAACYVILSLAACFLGVVLGKMVAKLLLS